MGPAQQASSPGSAMPWLPHHIAVVNSLPRECDAEVALLQSHGYPTTAHDASHKVDALRDADFPDLFVINLGCGHEDGIRLTKRIRQRSTLVGIVLITAAAADSRPLAFLSGADNHLARPYHAEELLAMVHSVCRRLPGRH